jgi:hypothetical protein
VVYVWVYPKESYAFLMFNTYGKFNVCNLSFILICLLCDFYAMMMMMMMMTTVMLL